MESNTQPSQTWLSSARSHTWTQNPLYISFTTHESYVCSPQPSSPLPDPASYLDEPAVLARSPTNSSASDASFVTLVDASDAYLVSLDDIDEKRSLASFQFTPGGSLEIGSSQFGDDQRPHSGRRRTQSLPEASAYHFVEGAVLATTYSLTSGRNAVSPKDDTIRCLPLTALASPHIFVPDYFNSASRKAFRPDQGCENDTYDPACQTDLDPALVIRPA